MMEAIADADLGDTALQSANGRDTPAARIASATSLATPTASAGTRIDMIRSASSTISSSDGTSTMPAFAARSLVRSLLPSRHVITLYPCSTSAFPTPCPMSPGLSIAIVSSPIRPLPGCWMECGCGHDAAAPMRPLS